MPRFLNTVSRFEFLFNKKEKFSQKALFPIKRDYLQQMLFTVDVSI